MITQRVQAVDDPAEPHHLVLRAPGTYSFPYMVFPHTVVCVVLLSSPAPLKETQQNVSQSCDGSVMRAGLCSKVPAGNSERELLFFSALKESVLWKQLTFPGKNP